MQILIGIGSNIEPITNVPVAVERLRVEFPDVRVSTIYRSAPVGRTDQAAFLNGVAAASTSKSTGHVIADLKRIEADLGRVRDPNDRNAPRTIDLDLLVYGDLVDESRDLPSRDLQKRWFVAIPAAQLVPAWVDPRTDEPLSEIAQRLQPSIDGEPFELDLNL